MEISVLSAAWKTLLWKGVLVEIFYRWAFPLLWSPLLVGLKGRGLKLHLLRARLDSPGREGGG